jgi:hypothetical protein
MRTIFILFLIGIFVLPELKGQEKNKGTEFRFSLIHPYRRSNEYKYSLDPSIEALYFIALSDRFMISGGFMAQTGNNNWETLTSHQFWDGWMWWPGRGYYIRELKYFCMGIPLRLEKKFPRFLFNSIYVGFTGSRYFIFDLTDSMGDRVIPVKIEYDKYFWDLQLGLTKNIYQSSGLSIGISPVAGARIHHTDLYSLNEYLWYGLSLSARLGK